MATSNIYLYEVEFKASQNAKLDNIESYLTSIGTVGYFTNFQYIKHDLDITIKIPYPQYRNTHNNINYVKIVNSDDLNFPFYYYVNKPIWKAQDTVELSLSLDTLNTFRDFLVFGNNTQIIRQHKDRFTKGNVIGNLVDLIPKIDRVPEDTAGLVKYNESFSQINLFKKYNGIWKRAMEEEPEQYMKWYLVYASSQGENISDSQINTAVSCYLVPEEDISVTTGAASYNGFDIATAQSSYRIFTSDDVTVNINGVDYTNTVSRHYGFGRYTTNTSGFVVYIEGTTVTRVAFNIDLNNSIIFSADTGATALLTPDSTNTWSLPIYNALDKNNVTFDADGTYTISSINNVDRTLSYLIKIIECPYAPLDITDAVDNGDVAVVYDSILNPDGMWMLALKNIDHTLEVDLGSFRRPAPVTLWYNTQTSLNANKSPDYETKLYHSDYQNRLLRYDSYVIPINYEDLVYDEIDYGEPTERCDLRIIYRQSNNISSNLYFKAIPVTVDSVEAEKYFYISDDITNNVLVASRNNEKAIYNSSYLNYMRTGYNYDKKAKNLQLSQGAWSTALNIGGSALSFGLSGITKGFSVVGGVSLATSGISSIVNTIFSNINTKNQIEQKKAEAKAQAVSVSGSDDLDLLNGYLGNKLWEIDNKVSDDMLSKIFDLFYLTGYACNQTGIPNTTSRYRFNFLQCEPDLVFEKDGRLVKYVEDIKERFRKGVTYFHRYDDFRQTKENWEEWLITE